MKLECLRQRIEQTVRAVGLVLLVAWMPIEASGQARIEPEADRILKAMAAYLGGIKTFTFDFDVDDEYLLRSGEKLQISAWGKAAISRAGAAHITRRGGFADVDMTFDGKTFTIQNKRSNAYAQKEIAGNFDAMIDTLRDETGLHLSGADLLYNDVLSGLLNEVESGAYRGTTFINGVECHYLTFRAKDVDWQIWIRVGDQPLPMKYVITSKWLTSAPQYAVRISNWNTNPQIDPKQFSFAPPAGAKKLDALPHIPSSEFVLEIE